MQQIGEPGVLLADHHTCRVPLVRDPHQLGTGLGFWKSLDGGVNWTSYFVAPTGASRQDYYPPVGDPYDPNHLVMAGHEMDYLVESVDGGHTWTERVVETAMGKVRLLLDRDTPELVPVPVRLTT